MFKVPGAYIVAEVSSDVLERNGDAYKLRFGSNDGIVEHYYVPNSPEETAALDAALATRGKVRAGYDGGSVVRLILPG
jgi:hypothetical protein